ncbi:MAG: hypothetical protein ACOCZ8_06040 [Bacteroidota bacterium]
MDISKALYAKAPADEYRRFKTKGGIEEALSFLKAAQLTLGEAVLYLKLEEGIDPSEAKRIVFLSHHWSKEVNTANKLADEFEARLGCDTQITRA